MRRQYLALHRQSSRFRWKGALLLFVHHIPLLFSPTALSICSIAFTVWQQKQLISYLEGFVESHQDAHERPTILFLNGYETKSS